jgi:hypothetical protein
VRFGIITPYTSYLAKEPELALTGEGRGDIVDREVHSGGGAVAPASGAGAVDKSVGQEALRQADSAYNNTPIPAPVQGGGGTGGASESVVEDSGTLVKQVLDKAFVLQDETWIDTAYDSSKMSITKVAFASDVYFSLLGKYPNLSRYFALGQKVIVVLNGKAYEVTEN